MDRLVADGVRFVVFGVSGANLHDDPGKRPFVTEDTDLFLPAEPENLVKAWTACEALGLSLWAGYEPLDFPRDLWLAERVVARRALTWVSGEGDFKVDLSLVMAGFEFEEVWAEKRNLPAEGVRVPVARLQHILDSKKLAGRPKDETFFRTHKAKLDELLAKDRRRRRRR